MATNLDPTPGAGIAAKVRARFAFPVHCLDSHDAFHLVVSFGRSSFPLSIENVGHALHACLGGDPIGFHVSHIRGSVFKFSVASKAVGFLVYNLRSFSCPSFRCFSTYGVLVVHYGSMSIPFGCVMLINHGRLSHLVNATASTPMQTLPRSGLAGMQTTPPFPATLVVMISHLPRITSLRIASLLALSLFKTPPFPSPTHRPPHRALIIPHVPRLPAAHHPLGPTFRPSDLPPQLPNPQPAHIASVLAITK